MKYHFKGLISARKVGETVSEKMIVFLILWTRNGYFLHR